MSTDRHYNCHSFFYIILKYNFLSNHYVRYRRQYSRDSPRQKTKKKSTSKVSRRTLVLGGAAAATTAAAASQWIIHKD